MGFNSTPQLQKFFVEQIAWLFWEDTVAERFAIDYLQTMYLKAHKTWSPEDRVVVYPLDTTQKWPRKHSSLEAPMMSQFLSWKKVVLLQGCVTSLPQP